MSLSDILRAYSGLLEIINIDAESIIDHGAGTLPAVSEITLADISEEYESKVVKINNISSITLAKLAKSLFTGNTEYTLSDEENTGFLYIHEFGDPQATIIGTPLPNVNFDVTGTINQYNGKYQICPRTIDDIYLQPDTEAPFVTNFCCGI